MNKNCIEYQKNLMYLLYKFTYSWQNVFQQNKALSDIKQSTNNFELNESFEHDLSIWKKFKR